jgi:hypothetical protein
MTKWHRIRKISYWFFGSILGLVLLITGTIYFFKDEIIQIAVGEINNHLKAKVEVKKVDLTFWATFPNLSIDFNEIFIQDALPNSTKKDTLLYSEQIRLKFDPMDIWNEKYDVKQINIAPGTLKLVVNKKGAVNYDIFKPANEQTSNKFQLSLKEVEIADLRFLYANELQGQKYATTFHEVALNGNFSDEEFTLHTDAAFTIHRVQNGLVPFVINQPATTNIDLIVNQKSGTVSLPKGKINLAGLPFDVTFFLDSSSFKTQIKADNLALTDVANKLAWKEVKQVNKFKGSGTARFLLNVATDLGVDAYPQIDCQFSIDKGKLTEPAQGLTISNLFLDGKYSTLKGKGNEELLLNNVSFHSFSGPFKGNLAIKQFDAPTYTGNANGSVDLGMIHALFHLPKINTIAGKVGVNSRFKLITLLSDAGATIEVADGNGAAQLNNVQFQLIKDSRKFSNINGKIILNKTAAVLENLRVQLGHSDMKINGLFNHVDAFLQDKANLSVEVTAESRKIDLEDFTNTVGIPTTSGGNAAPYKKDWLLPTMIDGSVLLDLGTLVLNQHHFTQIHGDMKVGNRVIQINQLTGTSAGAAVTGGLTVQESAPERFDIATKLAATSIDFKRVFNEWNNFEQDVISADNISGRAELLLDLKAPFDFNTGIIKEALVAQIQLAVYDGKLKNVETLTQLTADLKSPKTRVVFSPKEIDVLQSKLSNLTFDKLENTIYIRNSTLIIPKMDIHSSALDMTLEGSHTFDNTIDYRFSFRLRELKLNKDESEFGEVIDDETGVRIYVRMHGNLDNPTIVWDQKARKDQARENREQAKQEALSILKSELGLFKKDTTIKAYQPKVQQREEIKIEFGKEEVDPAVLEKEKKKKQSKIAKFGDKLKEENKKQKEKDVEFTVE